MTKSEYLQARALIADPRNWTQGMAARGQDGTQVFFFEPTAVQFCAVGACRRATNDPCVEFEELDSAAQDLGYGEAYLLNDRTDHATVLRMFDLAIEMAEEA